MIFQQLANSFKGGHVDGNSIVKRACHGVVTGWVTSWEVSPVRREVWHQPYLVKSSPRPARSVIKRACLHVIGVVGGVRQACRAWARCGGGTLQLVSELPGSKPVAWGEANSLPARRVHYPRHPLVIRDTEWDY